MVDNYKKMLDEKIALAKKMAKPTDAMPLIRFIYESRDKLSMEDRQKICDILEESSLKIGQVLLDRALSDGTMTDEMWIKYKGLGLDERDMCSILQGYYGRKDGYLKDNRIVIVSSPDTAQYENRELLCEAFDVEIVDPKEATEILKEEAKKDELSKM